MLQKVVRSTVIDAPVERVWAVLRDFNSHDRWHDVVAESAIEGGEKSDQVGCVRAFTLKDGNFIREQLLTLDDRTYKSTYCIVEATVPLQRYVATVTLKPVTDGNRTFWHWESTFATPPGRERELRDMVAQGVYEAGFENLRRHLRTGGDLRVGPSTGGGRGAADGLPAALPLPTRRVVVSRYGGADGASEYFYIFGFDGTAVMHPMRPEWAGTSMLGKLRDADGNDSLKNLIDAAVRSADGRGSSEALFPRPGQSAPVPKLQYAQRIDGWNWVVGSGVYMDDLAAVVRAGRIRDALVALLLLAIVAAVGWVVTRSVLRQIGGDPAEAMAVMDEVARGNLGARLDQAAPHSLLHALQTMIAALRRTIEQVHASTGNIRVASGESKVQPATEPRSPRAAST
jgi:hypothetical protein